MLKIIVDAKLPLVAIRSPDLVNFVDILEHVVKQKAMPFKGKEATGKPNQLYWVTHPYQSKETYGHLYASMIAAQSTLIVVNPTRIEDEMFDAGEMPVPKDMIDTFMNVITEDIAKAKDVRKALGAVTLKESAELARLTMARDGGLTPNGIMSSRKEYFQEQPGLTLVDSNQSFYLPTDELKTWIGKERPFFMNDVDPRLVPRGLLLDGPPGVGKTSGAKFIAAEWGIPLYRVDIGATKNKYVGESENRMLANLNRLDAEEPCVALFDEVEKVFGAGDYESSTTTTMMSQLLWWLAEREAKVLVVMTTNKADKLPPELHREGRIDQTMVFQGLQDTDALVFVSKVVKTFQNTKLTPATMEAIVKKAKIMGGGQCAHAQLTTMTYSAIKELGLPQ